MKKLMTTAALALATFGTAHAMNSSLWYLVGKNTEGTAYFYDLANVRVKDSVRQVWALRITDEQIGEAGKGLPQDANGQYNAGSLAAHALQLGLAKPDLVLIDCQYDKAQVNGGAPFDIAPSSMLATMEPSVCKITAAPAPKAAPKKPAHNDSVTL